MNTNPKTNTEPPQTTEVHKTIDQQLQKPPPSNRQQPKLRGGLNAFYWRQIFALDLLLFVKTQTIFAMHYHRETSNQINTLWWNK